MNDSTFFPSDIVRALHERLSGVRRASNMKFPLDDEFELGINCRMSNEAEWLEDLLEKIELKDELSEEEDGSE